MIIRQAFKYQLRPNGAQVRSMRRFAGCCRFVYNQALALQQDSYRAGGKYISYVAMAKHLTAWRNSPETPWLSETPVHPQQQAFKDLERAYRNFFEKRAGFPRFKRKWRGASFRYPDPKQIKLDQGNRRIFLPKLGWLRYRHSRPVPGEVKNVTVSENAGKWYISVQTEREVPDPVHPARTVVGVDMGVSRFATLSSGKPVLPPETEARYRMRIEHGRRRLTRAQRALSRKEKFSRNWIKAKARVQKCHARLRHLRADWLHQHSTRMSKNHAVIVIEDLAVRNMTRSAKGTVESPGKNVRAKSGLNRAILEQGWSEHRRMLEYKQLWLGGMVLPVPPAHSSQTCSACGHADADNRKSQALFLCTACGHRENADDNASKNILAAGHAAAACGGDVSPWTHIGASRAAPVKQEPAEVTQGGTAVSGLSAVGIPFVYGGEDVKDCFEMPPEIPPGSARRLEAPDPPT